MLTLILFPILGICQDNQVLSDEEILKLYDISMQIGELVLFPAERKQSEEVIIAATDTRRIAKNTVEVLWEEIKP